MTAAASLVGQVHAILLRRHETVAVAESLTGGLLAAALTDLPGASAIVRGGLVVYATDLKASLAGVPAGLLAERGPVHADVAAALADGARATCGADWGVGITGVAGPELQGGQPVGTVWIGVSGHRGSSVRLVQLSGGRPQIRTSAVDAALEALLARLGDLEVTA